MDCDLAGEVVDLSGEERRTHHSRVDLAREVLGQVMTAISPDDAAWPEGGEKAVEYIEAALAAERERCEKAEVRELAFGTTAAYRDGWEDALAAKAAAIRELGEDR